MAQYFIDHPRFAWVISILLVIAGLISLRSLPISAYPDVAPPQITLTAIYPGASAKTIEDSVTTLIEDEMSGLEGLEYLQSKSSRDGTAVIILTFAIGTDTDLAAVDVQNRMKKVEPRLPSNVRQQGIRMDKTRPDFLMVVSLYSPNGTYNSTDLNDYLNANIIQDIRRLPGVGTAASFGSGYAMRIWIDPKKMYAFGIAPNDIVAAIQNQNAQLAAGELGALPSPANQQINATVVVPSSLSTAEEFGNVILRSSANGATVRLRDVATVERGAKSYAVKVLLNGQPSAGFSVKLSNTGNALETATSVKTKMDELSQFFPPDMAWKTPYDTSLFVDISIKEVIKTLAEAIVLVTIVMFVFLQSWRTTIIPLVTVPISLIGTAIGLYLLGFSINMLTLFGMVLAIGIVVDDAILVVENVIRLIHDEKLSPYQAAKKSMKQISGAIIGTTAVLIAVFVPMAFMSGSAGKIYQQFSLTIIVSVAISSFLALTLSPAMAQGLLKDKAEKPFILFKPLVWLGKQFDKVFGVITNGYMWLVKGVISKIGIVLILIAYGATVYYDYSKIQQLPKGFLPSEDQGFIVVNSLLPAGATQERTLALSQKTDGWLLAQPEVEDVITVLGFSFMGNGQNASVSFAQLKPWKERITKGMRDADQLVAATQPVFGPMIGEGIVFGFNMPPIPGLGNDNGFDFRLQNRTNNPMLMQQAMGQLMGMVAQHSDTITGFRPNTLPPAPQLKIDIDHDKASSLGIDFGQLNYTIQAALGSFYINDYLENGKVRQVWVQANDDTRSTVDDILSMQVRNNSGGLVDLREIATAEWVAGPAVLDRYNNKSALPFMGQPAKGKSSGEAMATMEALASKLPAGISYEWSGMSYQEKQSGGQAIMVFALSFLITFLVLVALYESWSVPMAVMLVVPLGVLGCVLAVSYKALTNDVYFTVGLITIVGLSTKNAIIIVEFARDLQNEGRSLRNAVLEACRLRFRPILMTSFAFILGVLPLVNASGAGAASRQAIGIGVFGGMLAATLLAIFFVPVFYLIIRTLIPAKPPKSQLENLEKVTSQSHTGA